MPPSTRTVTVPPGGAVAVEVKLDVPGKFLLVDHALSRMEKGLMAIVDVEGDQNPAVFKVLNPDKSAAIQN